MKHNEVVFHKRVSFTHGNIWAHLATPCWLKVCYGLLATTIVSHSQLIW